MAVPLKKDRAEDQNLTTADLAQGTRTEERPGPKPVASDRSAGRTSDLSSTGTGDSTPLFPGNELEDLRRRWSDIQTAFVDEPRKAVEQADGLVASAMKRIAEGFADERSKLEKQWDRGDNVSTEDLRVALQRYRTFFHRLLSI
jgi:hypothetical protein